MIKVCNLCDHFYTETSSGWLKPKCGKTGTYIKTKKDVFNSLIYLAPDNCPLQTTQQPTPEGDQDINP